jgi:GH18 family chitinase
MSSGRIAWCYAVNLILAAASAWAGERPMAPPTTFRVVGYLPEYRAGDFDPGAARGLTDLIVFSAEPTADGGLECSRLANLPWASLRAFKTRERVRLILCVGGWERSAHFPIVARSPDKRKTFADAAVRTCLEQRLDGIDLDWEHPKDEVEQDSYGKLLTELGRAFEPHGLVLSVTLAAWQKLPKAAYGAADRIQIMAYDHQGRHATLESAKADVKTLLDAGVPATKIVLGVPFYGRQVTEPRRALTYREIVTRHNLNPDVDEIDGVYFNGPDTIRRKTEFALDTGLGGVMVWELGQDAPGDRSLLGVIRAVVDRRQK